MQIFSADVWKIRTYKKSNKFPRQMFEKYVHIKYHANFLCRCLKYTYISNIMQIRPAGGELLHADRRTGTWRNWKSLFAPLRRRLKKTAIRDRAGCYSVLCISVRFERFTRWFKYDRDWFCVNKSQFVSVIFEPPYNQFYRTGGSMRFKCDAEIMVWLVRGFRQLFGSDK